MLIINEMSETFLCPAQKSGRHIEASGVKKRTSLTIVHGEPIVDFLIFKREFSSLLHSVSALTLSSSSFSSKPYCIILTPHFGQVGLR